MTDAIILVTDLFHGNISMEDFDQLAPKVLGDSKDPEFERMLEQSKNKTPEQHEREERALRILEKRKFNNKKELIQTLVSEMGLSEVQKLYPH